MLKYCYLWHGDWGGSNKVDQMNEVQLMRFNWGGSIEEIQLRRFNWEGSVEEVQLNGVQLRRFDWGGSIEEVRLRRIDWGGLKQKWKWKLLIQVVKKVKVANPGSCDETKVKVSSALN